VFKAGQLRHRVTLWRATDNTSSPTGQHKEDFSDAGTVWAELLELRGREYHSANELNSEVSAKIRIRYREDVKSSWRVTYKSRTFEILSPPINVMGFNRYQELMVKEINP